MHVRARGGSAGLRAGGGLYFLGLGFFGGGCGCYFVIVGQRVEVF